MDVGRPLLVDRPGREDPAAARVHPQAWLGPAGTVDQLAVRAREEASAAPRGQGRHRVDGRQAHAAHRHPAAGLDGVELVQWIATAQVAQIGVGPAVVGDEPLDPLVLLGGLVGAVAGGQEDEVHGEQRAVRQVQHPGAVAQGARLVGAGSVLLDPHVGRGLAAQPPVGEGEIASQGAARQVAVGGGARPVGEAGAGDGPSGRGPVAGAEHRDLSRDGVHEQVVRLVGEMDTRSGWVRVDQMDRQGIPVGVWLAADPFQDAETARTAADDGYRDVHGSHAPE